jgi:formylglycine-generating enzyme required for sulfatase activity
MYDGLELAPQVGLLPIGRDPRSGLWEFAHLRSGAPARRDPVTGELRITEQTGIVLVLVPGGAFAMGGQREDPSGLNYAPHASTDEGPVTVVRLSPYLISKFEMTQAQWIRCADDNPSIGYPGNPDLPAATLLHPVDNVHWNDCTRLLMRFGLRLPTEAEWEHAARAGTTTAWSCGDDPAALQDHANIADVTYAGAYSTVTTDTEAWSDGHALHAPVGSFLPNAFGLHDVHGNVRELCGDGFSRGYAWISGPDPFFDPAGTEARVSRGGDYGRVTDKTRSSFRHALYPDTRDPGLGLRPARGIDPPPSADAAEDATRDG